MKIIIDAMSGDNAPLAVIKGTSGAKEKYRDVDFVLVGKSDEIKKLAEENKIDIENIEIREASDVITMNDEPISAIRNKKESSMVVALRMLADGEGDAVVSAGNTGALFAGASLIVRKMKGILRPAIGSILPFDPPVLLLDSGANLVVSDEIMEQFAFMGSAYMKKMYALPEPRVGILNNGEEGCKGLQLQIDTYKRLSGNEKLNFVGNVEANRLMSNTCDILLADGFSGNILLKTVEGMGKMSLGILKKLFKRNNLLVKLSLIPLKKDLMKIKRDFDPSEYGGAPILGISKPVIKAHGASDARAIGNAIREAINYASSGVAEDIEKDALEFAARRHESAAAEKGSGKGKEE